MIGRRQFIAGLGSAAAWPVVAGAQQAERVRRIGWLSTALGDPRPGENRRLAAFKRGLADLGWIEGRNLLFEGRWTDYAARTPSVAAELAALRPDVIFVWTSAALAAVRRATGNIPIVFSVVTDPVAQGFVSSLAQPGGNITGFASQLEIGTKRLELLKKIAPALARVAAVYDPGQISMIAKLPEIEVAATQLGIELARTPVRSPDELERLIEELARTPDGGLLVDDLPPARYRERLVVLAARYHLPAIYPFRSFVASGGLASYAADDIDLSRRAASYADRILKGDKPADLPVQFPTKFELVINLKTAKALGLTIPETLLATADEVIE